MIHEYPMSRTIRFPPIYTQSRSVFIPMTIIIKIYRFISPHLSDGEGDEEKGGEEVAQGYTKGIARIYVLPVPVVLNSEP